MNQFQTTTKEEDEEELKYNIRQNIMFALEDVKDNLDINMYSDAKFDENLYMYIKECIFNYVEFNEELFENVYNECIEEVCNKTKFLLRSYRKNLDEFDKIILENNDKLDYLRNVKQPEQKSDEWYIFRKNHITGSNAWKIFHTEGSRKQLIYEKLQPTENCIVKSSLNENPFNWGHKYEPLTNRLYEYYNDVKVEEFGCIPHKTIPFLAASPDGIIVSKKNNGRMIEIKNVVSREITGIPKMEYYIQMQIQLEVCDLDECDFVETKFVEYNSYEDFKRDKYNVEKGMIIVLIENDSKFIYEYSNLFQNSEQELQEFTNEIYNKYELDHNTLQNENYKWYKTVYWKLHTFSCVLVPRNKEWFNLKYPKMEEFWNLIEQEKNSSDENVLDKYKPKQRQSKQSPVKKPVVNLFNECQISI